MEAEESQRESQYEQSQYSSEDEDGKLLTNKVEEKLLAVVAKLKAKDPSMYDIKKPIFEDQDFEERDEPKSKQPKQTKNKLTYKELVTKKDEQQSEEELQEEKKDLDLNDIKENFKRKLQHGQQKKQANEENEDLFKVKKKIELPKKSNQQKMKQFVSSFGKQSEQLLTGFWKNQQKLDKTDLFLRNYIINERWKTSQLKKDEIPLANQNQEMIDEQDEVRSIQMDQYEAKYNFRFQEPGSDKIVQYPREVPQSMRVKPETRKEKRKKLTQRKKQQQEEIRKENELKKHEKKQQILQKLKQSQTNKGKQEEESSDFEHDWFFCDDCTKALEENEQYYVCNECGQYMLCQQCHELIIHKHPMERAVIPKGFGPPQTQKAQKALSKLINCKTCRKKIPHYLPHYEYIERSSRVVDTLCEKCYDQASLQIKKKFKLVEPKSSHINYQELLDKNPEKIKQLNTQKDIQELVDQYLKYDFEDVIGGGLKTKFKYINVKPESYGLSDEQILYGDDKELNKYVSIKKLGPYQDEEVKLRNSIYNKKIKSINKSALQNKKIITKSNGSIQGLRSMKKMQTRAQILRKRRQNRNKKLKIINISNPEDEKKYLLPKSRLQSYGLATEEMYNKKNKINPNKSQMEVQQK